jgi:Lamin Tail Domain/Secretion system C-terminal sorting domain
LFSFSFTNLSYLLHQKFNHHFLKTNVMKRIFTLVLLVISFSLSLKSQVVIYEVYGGGGSTAAGPVFSNDYLVLLNKGNAAVSLAGWSIQYASATGPSAGATGTWIKVDITAGSIAAKKFFLIKVSPNTNTAGTQYTGILIPTSDYDLPTSTSAGGISMSGTGGKVALVNDNVALVSTMPATSNIVDLVGWGGSTTFFEGAVAPATTSSTAIRRINNGQDTNNNGADFAVNLTPTPLNSLSASLPIELTSFNASTKNATTKLTWQTASEKNNSHFAIERSQNGETFSSLGEVKGIGNSITAHDYSFTDATPYKGINYYRLRQVDFDGTESVSKTVSVNFDGKGRNKMKVYPTLVQDNLTVEVEGDAKSEITVRDLTGRVILTKNTEGPSAQILNMSGLSNGLYLLSVRSNDGFETIKITKQ